MPAPRATPAATHPGRALLWAVVGLCWLIQFVVPWTTSGTFSRSSMLGGVQLLRAGALDALLPGWVVVVLLLGPLLALVLLATAGSSAWPIGVIRVVACAALAVLYIGCLHTVTGADLSRLGYGGALAGAGLVLGVLGVATEPVVRRGRPRKQET